MLSGLLVILIILVCVALIGVVLLQRSEGGAFGMGGGPGGLITARGAGDLLTRTTWILFSLFLALCLGLTLLDAHDHGTSALLERMKGEIANPNALNQPKPPAAALPGAPAPVTPAPGPQSPSAPFMAPQAPVAPPASALQIPRAAAPAAPPPAPAKPARSPAAKPVAIAAPAPAEASQAAPPAAATPAPSLDIPPPAKPDSGAPASSDKP